MSWDSYLDNLVAQTKDANGHAHADKGCIISLESGASWTTNDHACALKIKPQEGATIAKCFKSKDFSDFMSNGVHIDGVKYQFLREEDGRVVYAKKKDHGALTLQCSKMAIIIGHTSEGSQQGSTNKGVAAIAEYLESTGM